MQAKESGMVPPDIHSVIKALVSNASVLLQEFSIKIDESNGRLCSLPDVLNGAVPRPRSMVALIVALSCAFDSEGNLDYHLACEVPSLHLFQMRAHHLSKVCVRPCNNPAMIVAIAAMFAAICTPVLAFCPCSVHSDADPPPPP